MVNLYNPGTCSIIDGLIKLRKKRAKATIFLITQGGVSWIAQIYTGISASAETTISLVRGDHITYIVSNIASGSSMLAALPACLHRALHHHLINFVISLPFYSFFDTFFTDLPWWSKISSTETIVVPFLPKYASMITRLRVGECVWGVTGHPLPS